MNDCSMIKCPVDSSTFKECDLTNNCPFYTKPMTNGDIIKAMFPNYELEEDDEAQKVYVWINHTLNCFDLDWWNAPY